MVIILWSRLEWNGMKWNGTEQNGSIISFHTTEPLKLAKQKLMYILAWILPLVSKVYVTVLECYEQDCECWQATKMEIIPFVDCH